MLATRDATDLRRRKATRHRAGLVAVVAASVLLWTPPSPLADPAGVPATLLAATDTVGSIESISRVLVIEAERKETSEELVALSRSISLSEAGIAALDAEIATLAADRDGIREAMIAAAAAQKAIERDIAATETRIAALAGDEGTLKASLRARRGLLAEVLGALQRIGRKPPPALLVRPDDALSSVRSAILLGAVVPRIRTETEKLANDLEQLARLKRDIAAEKEKFVAGMRQQREEEARLSRLFAEKEKLEAGSRERRQAEKDRAAELAAKATSLQDLIASLEAEADGARRAEEAARREAEALARLEAERQAETARVAAVEAERLRLAAIAEREREAAAAKAEQERIAALKSEEERLAAQQRESERLAAVKAEEQRLAAERAETERLAALETARKAAEEAAARPVPDPATTYDIASLRRDMARLESAAAFSTMKGRLSYPVSGNVRVAYGTDDGIGRPASGMTFEARSGDLVTAPADGRVLYSGPFRSYGQLLILDAGDGYHVVLAGMSQIDVDVGQFVLSGEPVAVMGAKRLASAALSEFGAAEPSLYVEFRKDGKPVDPAPWWVEGPSGRTRNDS